MEAEEGDSLSEKSEGGNERARRRTGGPKGRDAGREDRRPQRKRRERGPEDPKEEKME